VYISSAKGNARPAASLWRESGTAWHWRGARTRRVRRYCRDSGSRSWCTRQQSVGRSPKKGPAAQRTATTVLDARVEFASLPTSKARQGSPKGLATALTLSALRPARTKFDPFALEATSFPLYRVAIDEDASGHAQNTSASPLPAGGNPSAA
jgi:hypothetical protein